MRTGIVFYSMNGNTAMAAEKLAKGLSADLIEIKPEKTYPDKGFKKLLPYSFKAEDYDLIIFGFHVWASNVTPPIRSFVKENQSALQGKKIAAFACQSGTGGEKAFRKLLECLGQEYFVTSMILIDPKDRPKPENDRKIDDFIKKIQEA